MINVLHLRDTDRVCGPGKTIIETACATNRDEFSQKVGLFMLDGERQNLYAETATTRGVELIPIRSAHPYDPRVVRTLARIVDEHDIAIVHSHEYKSDLLTFALARIRPVLIMTTIHGWITYSWKRQAMVSLSQRLLRYFDRVIAVSEETRRRVRGCGVDDSRLVTIYNCIVTENYRRNDVEPGYLRARFNLPQDASIIGTIGRLSPEKGQFDFLEAAARVSADFPNAYFCLAGDGPDRAGLEQRAHALGIADRTLFTGFLPDVRPVYRDLDILALTSYTEGFPNVVLESLCMEVPVLATAVGGTGEIIENGRTGVLIPPSSPPAIAEGLLALLRDRAWAHSLMQTGRTLVYDKFSFRNRVRREEQVYRDMLKERPRRATLPVGTTPDQARRVKP